MKTLRKREKALKKAGKDTADESGDPLEKLEEGFRSYSASDVFQFLHTLRTKHKIRSISFCPVQPKKGLMGSRYLSSLSSQQFLISLRGWRGVICA